jgi:hypothetical protein
VKRRSGEDTWRVAAWENSSVPGILFPEGQGYLYPCPSFFGDAK